MLALVAKRSDVTFSIDEPAVLFSTSECSVYMPASGLADSKPAREFRSVRASGDAMARMLRLHVPCHVTTRLGATSAGFGTSLAMIHFVLAAFVRAGVADIGA